MNMRQIEAFRFIMITGTTARAAEAMFTSQPAISRLLSQLESSLRMRLFEREKSRLRPTPEAKRLLVEVERAFTGLDQIRERAKLIRSGNGGHITVACLPALGFGPMPLIISKFRSAYPDTMVRLEIHGSSEVKDIVASGRCDIGFAAEEIDTYGIKVQPVVARQALLAVPVGHPLCSRKHIRIEHLIHYPFIALSQRDTARRQLDELLAEKGLEMQLAAEAAYSLTIASLVKAKVGIGLVNPLALVELDCEGLELLEIKEKIVFKVLALSNAASPMSAPAKQFLDAVIETLNAL